MIIIQYNYIIKRLKKTIQKKSKEQHIHKGLPAIFMVLKTWAFIPYIWLMPVSLMITLIILLFLIKLITALLMMIMHYQDTAN